jgi:hypothetical protein
MNTFHTLCRILLRKAFVISIAALACFCANGAAVRAARSGQTMVNGSAGTKIVKADGGTAGNGLFPVTAYGAVGDSITDCTGAFLAAIDSAFYSGGGTALIPPGKYRLTRPFYIQPGITLEGSYKGGHLAITPPQGYRGSMLIADFDGSCDTGQAFISLWSHAGLSGVDIYYPRQTLSGKGGAVPYPFTIAVLQDNSTIMNVTLINSYQGIDLTRADGHPAYLKNISMCALSKGIVNDSARSADFYDNINLLGPTLWNDPRVDEFQLGHLTGYVFYQSYVRARNCDVTDANIGYQFGGESRVTGGTGPLITLVNCTSESKNGKIAFEINETDANGILFSNCAPSGRVIINATEGRCAGPVNFSNCAFNTGFGGPACHAFPGDFTVIEKRGKGTLSLSNCNFVYWGNNDKAAVHVHDGTALIANCDFNHTISGGPRDITVESPASVSISGCRLGKPLDTAIVIKNGTPPDTAEVHVSNCLTRF